MTREEALAYLRVAREMASEHAPETSISAAHEVLDVLERHAGAVSVVGSEICDAIVWWCDPTKEPGTHPPIKGAEAGIAELLGATDELVQLEDARREALDQLRRALVEIGLDLALKALPFLIAAL